MINVKQMLWNEHPCNHLTELPAKFENNQSKSTDHDQEYLVKVMLKNAPRNSSNNDTSILFSFKLIYNKSHAFVVKFALAWYGVVKGRHEMNSLGGKHNLLSRQGKLKPWNLDPDSSYNTSITCITRSVHKKIRKVLNENVNQSYISYMYYMYYCSVRSRKFG